MQRQLQSPVRIANTSLEMVSSHSYFFGGRSLSALLLVVVTVYRFTSNLHKSFVALPLVAVTFLS